MFPKRYYPDRMFAPRYYPKIGATVTIPRILEPTYLLLDHRGATRAALEVNGQTLATLEHNGATQIEVTS